MAAFIVRFDTHIDLSVTVEADDEEAASEAAWEVAEDYLRTVHGNSRGVVATATLDGLGHYEIEAQAPAVEG